MRYVTDLLGQDRPRPGAAAGHFRVEKVLRVRSIKPMPLDIEAG